MSEKINIKELEAIVSNIVNELGVSEVFNEEMNKQIQEKIRSKISGEKDVMQEDETDDLNIDTDEQGISIPTVDSVPSEMPDLSTLPTGSQVVAPTINTPEVVSTPEISIPEPQLPSFIEKAEPAKVFVFDYNELSLGGENMANRSFRLMSDPDIKKSMHDMWIEDGKIRAEVYVVKFEKLGEIKFNPFNTTANLEEKKFDPTLNNIAQPFNENPYEPKVEDESIPVVNPTIAFVADNELESKIYDIITKMIKGSTIYTNTGPVGINIDAISKGQVKNSTPEPTDTLKAINNQKEVPIMEEILKMNDLVKDSEFSKINTPEELIEGIKGKPSKATLLSKNEEVQTWVFENKTYYLPANIISARKCYINKKTL